MTEISVDTVDNRVDVTIQVRNHVTSALHHYNPYVNIGYPRNGLQSLNNIQNKNFTTTENFIVDHEGYMHCTSHFIIGKKYKITKQIGKGTFSTVFESHDYNKCKYAVKVTRKSISRKHQKAAQNELYILQKIGFNDPNNTSHCIHIIECFQFCQHSVFVFPLLSSSIYSFLKYNKHKPFSYDDTVSLMYQILSGVSYVHSLGIIIADLKSENIMLVDDRIFPNSGCLKNTEIRLIDFGNSVMHNNNTKHSHFIQTRNYRAPEVIFNLEWDFSVDVWSIGCELVELIHGKRLFSTYDNIDHLNQMVKCIDVQPSSLLESIDDNTWNSYFNSNCSLRIDLAAISPCQCKKLDFYFKGKQEPNKNWLLLYDLCAKMLRWKPEHRISCKEALKHKVFKNMK